MGFTICSLQTVPSFRIPSIATKTPPTLDGLAACRCEGKPVLSQQFPCSKAAISSNLLSLWNLLSKMPDRTVGSQGLILRGTFREHFTFHSWQAEMDCQMALREKP